MGAAGTTFPGGIYRIGRADNEALCEAVGTTADPGGRAHPIFYFIGTQVGSGISVADLLALCDFDVADGPLMAGSSAAWHGELMVDADYRVAGEILSLVRKPSRTFGAVDLLSFRLTLTDSTDLIVVECTNQWVLPRRGETAA
jgi:hypothetical protein